MCLFLCSKFKRTGDIIINTVYGVIYCATNKTNEKKYIGQTTRDVKRRIQEHISLANSSSNYAFQRAIRKYGEDNFEWLIIDSADNQRELDDKEIHWIEHYNTFYEGGYNMTVGGQHSTEGSPDEISMAMGGKPFLVYDLDGNFIKETVSQKQFAEEIGVAPGTPNNVLLGKKNQIKGYVLIFKNEFSEEELKKRIDFAINNQRDRSIYVFDKSNLSFIGSWDNRAKCSEDLNIGRSTITNLLNDKDKRRRTPYIYYCNHFIPDELKQKTREVI